MKHSHKTSQKKGTEGASANPAKKLHIYNVVILDRSGSMYSCLDSTIAGFNELLGSIKASARKASATQEHTLTLVLFDSESIDTPYVDCAPSAVKPLSRKTYVPGAATPLYDAIGKTITDLRSRLDEGQMYSVVLTIITDGLENASTEYSHSAVQKMIEVCKEDGWVVSYMGCSHDVLSAAASISITNVISFEQSDKGTRDTFRKEAMARERYFEDADEAFCSLDASATPAAWKKWRKSRSEDQYKDI